MAITARPAPGEPVIHLHGRQLPWLLEVHRSMFRTKPLGAFGAALVLLLVFAAVFADLIAGDPTDTNLRSILQSPSTEHWFGTDMIGRDIFDRVVHGARVSITVGVGAVGLGTMVAIVMGTLGAMRGGVLDIVIQRFVDAWIAIPWLVFLLAAMTILQPGVGSIILVLALGISFNNSRVVRGAVLSVMAQPYLEAARSLGATDGRLIVKHIVPNIMAPVIVVATLGLGNVILAEAALSFLGFGIPPPTPAWGGMLSGTARDYMYIAPWMMIFPGIAITLTVFGFNMYGDALRDLLDPRLRGSR
ncbi:MAG: ABC transporter permease subunit [Dehalococcoidia bacterium]|nr:ABC transporter permease subunit [Dehalococcoidia bacterium]